MYKSYVPFYNVYNSATQLQSIVGGTVQSIVAKHFVVTCDVFKILFYKVYLQTYQNTVDT